MLVCPSCGLANPAGSRFCNGCGARLDAGVPASEERRTVTILFADLAGFTSRAEALDPEDVRAFLHPYYLLLEREIAGFGGVIERHLGDGVMAQFGAPTAHEDDPERAVRAALAILERLPDLGLDLHGRIGINTGPVLFASGGPGREDAVTGDTVNTAARLQALAPTDGVVVGPATHAATKVVFEYEALPPATVKGKAEPVAVFRPLAPRARLGTDLTRTHDGPFVGREIDLALLRALFDKTRRRSVGRLRHRRRGAGSRQEPDRIGALRVRGRRPGARHLAPGAVPPVRRGDHVLGAGRDPQGPRGHPRVRPLRGRDREARGGPPGR